MKLSTAISAAILGTASVTCVAQTANTWHPINASTEYHVKNAWYDLRTFGSMSRVGMTFAESGTTFYYYFAPNDAVALQKAHAIYASLLTALSTEKPVFLYITGPDSFASGAWDFNGIQVGAN